MIERSRVRIPAGAAVSFSSPGSTFGADSYFWYPFHPRLTANSTGGRLQLNTHTPYVGGFARSDMVHGCMVYTELAPGRQQFHVAPAMPAL